MARINLLPWREELRKQRQQQFYFLAVGSALVMALVVVFIHLQINGMISEQEGRNRFLENEIKKVEEQIKEIEALERKKAQLLARMRVIERLQGNRPEVVHLFEQLVVRIPAGLYFTQVEQKERTLTIQGHAQSNARVSSMMRNLDASEWLENPALEVIEASSKGGERSRTFTLTVQQTSGKEE